MRLNADIKIIGKQVVLVPYEKCHVNKYHKWMENDELRRQTASERLSLEEEYEMQRSWREDDDKCTFIILSQSLLDQYKDEISSMIGDVNIFLHDGVGELEIMIAESEWRGHGIAKECVALMIRYAYDHIHINKFQVKISEDNAVSIAMFQKLGFEQTAYSKVFKEYTFDLHPSKLLDIISDVHLNIHPYQLLTNKISQENRNTKEMNSSETNYSTK
ncbi:unnamed protein product [Anisakis simplex]|uniref:N-acetyltransferase 9-like protein (inferred by orthology to a C. elegans protein) n=1 Tax=Anisakis simplex TaxID=6269 RepID=A0A0M3J5M9_ANISI|nr:unnamed protein product [Anisakis simplex]